MCTGFTMIGTYIACTAAGLVVYYLTAKKVKRDEIEMRSAQNVIFPLLIAERDREFLRQLRRNRDEEAELMKNVPGWEVRLILYHTEKPPLLRLSLFACFQVGTYYGEPVYKTLPEDTLVTPIFKEFYAHTDWKAYAKRANLKLWS